MSYNQSFMDKIDRINKRAKDMNFNGTKAWAKAAMSKGELTASQCTEIQNLINMRNNMGHGHASEINVNADSLNKAGFYLGKINRSHAHPISNNQNNNYNANRNNNNRNDNRNNTNNRNNNNNNRNNNNKNHNNCQQREVEYTTANGIMARELVKQNNISIASKIDGSKMQKLKLIVIDRIKKWPREKKIASIEYAAMEDKVPLLCTTSRLNSITAEAIISGMSDKEINDILKRVK